MIEDEERRDDDDDDKAEAGVVQDGEEKTPDATGELDEAVTNETEFREEREESQEKPTQEKESEQEVDTDKEEEDDAQRDESRTQPQVNKQPPVITADGQEAKENNDKCENNSLGGVGRKLVVSKQPKIYQVKAVPIVPPKPQHCKITALNLRQQQQQRERRDHSLRVPTEQDQRPGDGEGAERPGLLREKRRDGGDGATRDANRNSPLSMCFDEAVAIATLRREKERVREGEAEGEGSGK